MVLATAGLFRIIGDVPPFATINDPRAPGDKAFQLFLIAIWATRERRIAHALKGFEKMSAIAAAIFVRGHSVIYFRTITTFAAPCSPELCVVALMRYSPLGT